MLRIILWVVLWSAATVADEAAIRRTVDYLGGLPSRISGYPGSEAGTQYIEDAFLRLGLDRVRREPFLVTIPVDEGGVLQTADGRRIALSGLWPNLVRTTTLPPEGLEAPMIYGGHGEYAEFNGKAMAGRVVLLEYNSWDHWLRAASLGARAIVFIAPEQTNRTQSEYKHIEAPIDVPRFWVDRVEGAYLRRLVGQGEVSVRLTSRMDWQERTAYNIVGILPGADPDLAEETIVLQTYYDGPSVVPAKAPAGEATGGIAVLLDLLQHFKEHPPGRTVVVAATDAHFQARRGITEFMGEHARLLPYYAERMSEPFHPKLFIGLDLSSKTDQLGLWNNTDSYNLKRFFVPFGRRFSAYAEEAAPSLGLDPEKALANGISPIKGMDWATFVPGGISTDGQVALAAGLVSLTFATVNDARLEVNSPLDTPDKVNTANLARQSALLKELLGRALSDPDLFADLEDFGPVLKDELRDVLVKLRAYPRRSQSPDRPVPNAVVVLNSFYQNAGGLTHKGVRFDQYHTTTERGDVHIKGMPLGGTPVAAYVLDEETGDIVYAPDLSKRAEKHHGAPTSSGYLVSPIRWRFNEKLIVMFPTVPDEIYGLIHSRQLRPLRSPTVLDRAGTAPRQFGFKLGGEVGVLFGPQEAGDDEGLKILMQGRSMMLINSKGGGTEEEARGSGYVLGRDSLTPTEYLAVRDMWRLNEARLQTMRRHAIENQRLRRLHNQGAVLIEKAEQAMEERQWDRFVSHVRAAMGVTNRAYPDVLGTLNDVIKGMVFFLALVIPAAFFGERLLFAASDIRWQLAGFGLILAVVWAIISQIHPAFAIAHPLIILLAFAIMVMAVFVQSMISGRFNTFMKEHRARSAKIHETDISRVSAAYAAFMLGISNMRRRILRTGLTLLTLTLLTFTVLSFTSFNDQVRFMAFAVPHDGRYEGALIRDRGWNPLAQATLDYAESHFEKHGVISPRNWYIAGDTEEKKYIDVRSDGSTYKATGLLGLAPQERRVTGIDQALVAGSFFEKADENSCLLSVAMAQQLGIGPEDVGRRQVQVFGHRLVVRGLFDPARFKAIADLDNEELTPADFQMSSTQMLGPNMGTQMDVVEDDNLFEIKPFVHLEPDNVAIFPFDWLQAAGGQLRSVAVRFDDGVQGRPLIEDFLTRLAITLFAGLREDGQENIGVFSYTSIGITSVEGLGALAIPMVIAALIVLNAMLGAVYERFREIGIYSSVGLAPMHIALLFVAEACVYAVIGVTLGYILGQGLGKVLIYFDLLGGLNLNYSSLSAIISAVIVMAVVLLSTIYPARVAAQTAVPDTVRRWLPPPPDGDKWVFEFPFMVSESEVEGLCGFLQSYFRAYSEESIGTFYAEMVRVVTDEGPKGREYAVQMLLWLAPFDMGVSQYVQLEFGPSTVPGSYVCEIFIQRISGQDTFWRRVNERFANGLRKEFLIWHTLSTEAKEEHTAEARDSIIDISQELEEAV